MYKEYINFDFWFVQLIQIKFLMFNLQQTALKPGDYLVFTVTRV